MGQYFCRYLSILKYPQVFFYPYPTPQLLLSFALPWLRPVELKLGADKFAILDPLASNSQNMTFTNAQRQENFTDSKNEIKGDTVRYVAEGLEVEADYFSNQDFYRNMWTDFIFERSYRPEDREMVLEGLR